MTWCFIKYLFNLMPDLIPKGSHTWIRKTQSTIFIEM